MEKWVNDLVDMAANRFGKKAVSEPAESMGLVGRSWEEQVKQATKLFGGWLHHLADKGVIERR